MAEQQPFWKRHRDKLAAGVVVFLVAVVVYGMSRPVIREGMIAILDEIQLLGWYTSMPLILLLYLLCNAPTFLPTNFLHFTCGFVYGIPGGFAVAEICYVITILPPFFLARRYFGAYVQRKVTGNPLYEAVLTSIQTEPLKITMCARMSPVIPGSINNLIFGVAELCTVHYLLGSAVGIAPQIAFFVYMGGILTSLGDLVSGATSDGTLSYVLLAVGLLATALLFAVMGKQATAVLHRHPDIEAQESTEEDRNANTSSQYGQVKRDPDPDEVAKNKDPDPDEVAKKGDPDPDEVAGNNDLDEVAKNRVAL